MKSTLIVIFSLFCFNVLKSQNLELYVDCITGYADLSTITADNVPSNSILTWHTSSSPSTANRITQDTAVSVGTYYAAYYHTVDDCYGYGLQTVEVKRTDCLIISADCELGTADLSSISSSNVPFGTSLTWHSSEWVTNSNKISDITSVGPGIYFATFYDGTLDCYSTEVSMVQIVEPNCIYNSCPDTSISLTENFAADSVPYPLIITWHTSFPVSDTNLVPDLEHVKSGTFFAAYFDTVSLCYSSDGYSAFEAIIRIDTCNADKDGITDILDIDDDNDGILDSIELNEYDPFGDADGDGILNWNDLSDDYTPGDGSNTSYIDSDGNGIPDVYDLDGDGILNHIDLDSDNDGIADIIETGGVDSNGDGRVDDDTDTDGDGYADVFDADNGGTALALIDTDGDGKYNMYDIDSDNDGIVDLIESQISSSTPIYPTGFDTDEDGLDNAFDVHCNPCVAVTGVAITPIDSDADGMPDYIDTDSDNDGFSDQIEGWDTDGDFIPNTVISLFDSDNDGLFDSYDNYFGIHPILSSTNNGQTSSSFPDVNSANLTSERDWREMLDADGDGIADYIDLDADNDGLPNYAESAGNDPYSDEDGDGIFNWLDTSDNGNSGDGSLTDYTDNNGDGIPDIYDFDGDGIPNHLDKDSDNDGITDIIEAGGVDINQDGEVDYPISGDPNSMVDADDDGIADFVDNVNSGSGPGEVTSGVGLPLPNSDSNGNVDFLDLDSDNDGIIDNTEAQATASYVAPSGLDSDGDGIDDAYDPDNGGVYFVPVNTEGTGNPDYTDTDSDDDGELDAIEGHDTDGDGIADAGSPANTGVSGGNSDIDGDGILDGWDNNTALRDPTNGGLSPASHPNVNAGGTEKDWRELVCVGGIVTLAPLNSTTIANDYCKSGDWTYYYNPSDPTQLLMAIEHKPAIVGGNTNDFSVEISLTVSSNPIDESGIYSSIDLPNKLATFVMGRYFNFNITSGSLNGAVNVRFYNNLEESDSLLAVANRWNVENADGTSYVSGLRWFEMQGGSFDPMSSDLLPSGIENSRELILFGAGVEIGIDYAEFLTSTLSGGGLAYTVGNNSVILPIELISFNVELVDNIAECKWVTSTEINNDYFSLFRSIDGIDWEFIAQVDGAGNSNSTLEYSYNDMQPLYGVSYYQLRQTDFNGKEKTVSIGTVSYFTENQKQVSIYPNPVLNDFQISGLASESWMAIKIYSSNGDLVYLNNDVYSNQSLNISNLSSGVYWVEVVFENQTFRKKMIKL